MTMSEPITEYARAYSGDDMLVRSTDPGLEKIYPTKLWIQSQTRFGGKVFRRTVLVVEDWTEVTAADVLG